MVTSARLTILPQFGHGVSIVCGTHMLLQFCQFGTVLSANLYMRQGSFVQRVVDLILDVLQLITRRQYSLVCQLSMPFCGTSRTAPTSAWLTARVPRLPVLVLAGFSLDGSAFSPHHLHV